MRNPIRAAFLAAAVAAFASPAAAQAPPVKILGVKVGLPPGRFVGERDDQGAAAHVVKNNTWAPVYLDLEIAKEVKRKAAVVIESKDADDLLTTAWVPLPDLTALPPGTQIKAVELPRLPYIRPSGRGEEIVVAVRSPDTSDPSSWRNLAEPARLRYLRTRDVAKYVVLSLGTKLPGFDLPKENTEGGNANVETGRALRNGRIETAAITEVALMPDRWFGYEAADLVVLTTGATDVNFLNTLFTDPAHRPRLDALLEWVRRGGRLVVSVGNNAQLVAQYEALREILPADVNRADAAAQLDELSLDWFVRDKLQRVGILQPRAGGKIPVANLVAKPDRGFRRLAPYVSDPGMEALTRPVVVQSAYGLGRVTLVAIDLDRSPFLELEPAKKADFWDLLLKEAGAAKASSSTGRQRNVTYYGAGAQSDTEDELAGMVRNHIDTFEGVPVISFGWVAVFIVLYTLLIGPVEYFVLKKVFKRLELTWITFPVIVLTVSAIAYFTAYSLKGDDLKINKLDVVDVDPGSNRVYGRSWFTVFSPRIESYTIATEPAAGWAAAGTDHPAPLVDWLGGSRSGRGGIFSRRYQYHCDPDTDSLADGLVGVPIQVWSTKAFASEWSARTDRAAPLVVSNLVHPPANRQDVAGTFTLNLPVKELRDVRLIYAGMAYVYENPITPGATVNVLLDKAEGKDVNTVGWGGSGAPAAAGPRRPVASFAAQSVMSALFHEATVRTDDATAVLQNATLRRLDQSWRLSAENRDEVIVVGRVEPEHGAAEAILTEPNAASPTVLWLKGLPGGGQARPPVPGTLRQETFVRVFVPVKPAARR